ncbi:alcohol dehydrogenase [Aulographum hederae CBS 113979]|uniref:Alcohol dehydrogenase n=1 Tax=Aulographum hederae CBS 113979 TaxID=1176131 RepID=A0A6G1GPP9_9PEZI|nr:alcohol dehydrogenase [Aulographum hederae CBS 113979]
MASALPKTFKAVTAQDTEGTLQVKDVPLNEPQQGELVIKVLACGVCHGDHDIINGAIGPLSKKDLIPGHEVVGTIVAVGPNETRWKMGDRVGCGWHSGHDGTCKSCQRGYFQCCENQVINGVTKDGGYAEYCTIRTEAAVRIPEGMDSAEAAPFLCAGVTVFNGIRQMGIMANGLVAIQGLGGLGHLAVQYSRKMGYRTVALSRGSEKKEMALQLGATDYLDASEGDAGEALQKMGGADLIVATAPNAAIVPGLIKGLGLRGKLLILAGVGEMTINAFPLLFKGQSIHGWPSGHALDSEEALQFAQVQGVKCLVEIFPLEKAKEAMEHMITHKVRFRAVLAP